MKHQEHFAHLTQLLKTERAEDRKQYEQKIRNRSVFDRRQDGVTWYPVIVNRSSLSTGERWVLEVERTQARGQRHLLQVGSSVSVFLMEEKITRSANGVVSRLSQDSMRIVLNREDPPSWLDDGKLGVDLLFDESTYEEMEKTMRKLQAANKGRILELIPILLGDQMPTFKDAPASQIPGLNPSQQSAVDHIRSAQDLALIHGPPGTGKTTTLVQAIVATVEQEQQVLVCTSSNAAVDLLVERLHQQDINVLRLGHPGRVDEEVVSHTLDVQLSRHDDARTLKQLRSRSAELKQMGRKYKRNFGSREREQRRLLLDESRKLKDDALALEEHMIYQLLQDAQVIACTLIGSNSDYLRSRRFKTLFIDEASQALEPASWVPILKADRVIMAGDHKQLPPTVKSLEAGRQGLSETIFERTINKYQIATMLDEQYRMHPAIAAFSNNYFYQGGIKNGPIIDQRRILFPDPVTYIDTAGCGFDEDINPETLSTFNKEQARFTLSYLDKLLHESAEARRCSIGIVAPYKAHVELLRNDIRDYEWFEAMTTQLTINSVDAFQGQERDIMLIDLARSNDRGEVGFLSDIRRTNVAMTRARHKLVIIGDSATLSSFEFYDELIQYFQEQGVYRSAFEYIY